MRPLRVCRQRNREVHFIAAQRESSATTACGCVPVAFVPSFQVFKLDMVFRFHDASVH